MKSFVQYSKNNDLCSVKPIEDIYKDRLFLQDIFSNLLLNSSVVIVQAMRPFEGTEKSIEKLGKIEKNIEGLLMNERKTNLSFFYYPKSEDYDFIQASIEIWFDFEHPGFIFLVESNLKIIEFLRDNELLSWKEIEKIAKGFCLFRDIEEDVLWISKHPELSFEGIVKG